MRGELIDLVLIYPTNHLLHQHYDASLPNGASHRTQFDKSINHPLHKVPTNIFFDNPSVQTALEEKQLQILLAERQCQEKLS
jgi:hypothetical protein